MIISDAAPSDVAALLAIEHGALIPRGRYRAMLAQLARGPAWAFRAAPSSPPLAVAGIVHGSSRSVAWLAVGPGARRATVVLSRRFRALVLREARRIGRPIEAEIETEEGWRLAWLCGAEIEGDRAIWGRAWGTSSATSRAASG